MSYTPLLQRSALRTTPVCRMIADFPIVQLSVKIKNGNCQPFGVKCDANAKVNKLRSLQGVVSLTRGDGEYAAMHLKRGLPNLRRQERPHCFAK